MNNFARMKSLEIETNEMINNLEDDKLRKIYLEKLNVMIDRIDSALDFFMRSDTKDRQWYESVIDELLDSCNNIKFLSSAIKVDLEMQELLK